MSVNPSINPGEGLDSMAQEREPTLLDCFLKWEAQRCDRIYLTQPYPDGRVVDYTWGEVGDQARRMAAHLRSFGWEPGARVAILSKNCAWWLLADYAIWMAGYVSVPIYPTLTAASVRQILEHSEARACFVGKLDAWDTMAPGIPGQILRIALPLAPTPTSVSVSGVST